VAESTERSVPNSAGVPAITPAEWLTFGLLLGAAATALWSSRAHGLMMLDEGYLLQPVQRMMQGELLYRDVFAHYAPLRFHLLAQAFGWLWPSVLVARTVLMGVVLVNVALTFRLARRFAPPLLAVVPAALVALVPGPWTKAFFGFTIASTALALARALERPSAARFAVLGLAAGVGLVTRQDVGLVWVAIAGVASTIPALVPARFGRTEPASVAAAARNLACTAGGVVLVVGGVLAWYAAHGGLGALVEMTLVRSFTQRSAYGFGLLRLLEAGGVSSEGRLAGTLLLVPIVTLAVAAPVWLLRVRRRGLDAQSVLIGALLGIACAALTNAYYQLYVLRFLQSAIPYYLLLTWAVLTTASGLRRYLGGIRGRIAQAATLGAALAAAGVLVWAILFGIAEIHAGDEYTGSVRARRLQTPVEVMGDTVFVDWGKAETIRLLRAFVASHVPPGDPIVGLPMHPMYWQILERPNPMWIEISDWVPGDFLLTEAEKEEQVRRIRDAGVRYAFVATGWLVQPAAPDALRRMLLTEFHPVRLYREMLVLERGADPDARQLLGILARGQSGRIAPADFEAALSLASRRPDDPLAHYVLGVVGLAFQRTERALVALAEAARLDPANPAPLEQRAEVLLRSGRVADAAADIRTVLEVRASPTALELARRLPPGLRPSVAAE